MRILALTAAVAGCLLSGVTGHDGHNDGYPEPFVGWTKEDLDAKWGTDVRILVRSCY